MLFAKDFSHLTAQDWAGIATKIIKLKGGEKLLVAVSDEHAGGVTSCMPQLKPVIDGFAHGAEILLLNGDDFEFESPAALMPIVSELKLRFPKQGADYQKALLAAAEDVLHKKVAEDIETLRAMIRENPNRKIVKVIGNHENFKTFRDALTVLEKQYPDNFQWTPELAIIPMPGGSKDTRDRLLATHGDLQMDDLWFVEDGGTDQERKCYTHREMAEKVVRICTKSWAPSAQKQEKGQGIVNWWRKPNVTAKTLYAELLFRAQEGDYHLAVKKTELDMDALQTTEEKLKKRRQKFKELQEELKERTDLQPEQREAEALVYSRAIERTGQQLEKVEERIKAVGRKSNALFPMAFKSPRTTLHYKKPGEEDSRLFTSKHLGRVSHINYGHTHVSAEAVEVGGLNETKVIVSNNASVTGAIMCRPLDDTGKPRSFSRKEDSQPDVGNLGVLLYRVKDGKITDITTVGRVIAENIHLVKQLIRDVPKPHQAQPDVDDRRERYKENNGKFR